MTRSIAEIFQRKIVSISFARRINLLGATTLGVGALMGAGIYVLIGLAAAEAGPGLWISYLACGLLVLPSVFVFAELSRRLPISGGGYVFAYHGLGGLGGFITGWFLTVGTLLACAMYSLGFAYYLGPFLHPDLSETTLRAIAAALIALLTLVNCRGTAGGDQIQRFLTWGNLFILLILVIFGILAAEPDQMTPVLAKGISGIGGAISIIYISFFGYQLIANTSEEIIDPERTVPLAMLLSILISLGVYLAVCLVSVLVVPWQVLAESKAPLVEVAAQAIGPRGWILVGAGGVLASAAALNGTLLSQGRQLYAMGKDRFLPSLLGRVHQIRQTPQPALLLGGLAASVAVISADLEIIAKIANFCFLSSMILVSVALIREYRVAPPEGRLKRWKWTLAPTAILSNLALLTTLDWISASLGIQVLLLGLAVYFFYSKRRGIRAKIGRSIVLLEEEEEKSPVFRWSSSLLVPMANPDTQRAILQLSEALLSKQGGEIVLLSVVTAPEQTDLTTALEEAEDALQILERSRDLMQPSHIQIRPVVRVSRSLPQGIVHAAEEERCGLIVMGYSAKSQGKPTSLIEQMLNVAPLDLVSLKLVTPFPPAKIAVALGGRDNLTLMVRLAGALADRHRGQISFLHLLPPEYTSEQKQEADQLLREAIRNHVSRSLYQIEVLTSERPLETMIEKSAEFDLLVVGTTRISFLERATVGSFSTQLAERSHCSVAIVRVMSKAKRAVSQFRAAFR